LRHICQKNSRTEKAQGRFQKPLNRKIFHDKTLLLENPGIAIFTAQRGDESIAGTDAYAFIFPGQMLRPS